MKCISILYNPKCTFRAVKFHMSERQILDNLKGNSSWNNSVCTWYLLDTTNPGREGLGEGRGGIWTATCQLGLNAQNTENNLQCS